MMKYLLNPWLCRAVFFILLVIGSWQSLTPKPAEAFADTSDKLLHIACWFILTIAMRMGFQQRFLLNCCLLFSYSALIEFGQIFVKNRFFSWLDISANGLGIVIASSLILLYCKLANKTG